jgi:hypothetical protein
LAALAAPLIFIALPCVGLVAAMAVLFESIHWLRGGFGNVVYFFIFLVVVGGSTTIAALSKPGTAINPYTDITGYNLIGESIIRAAKAVYPESSNMFSFMGGVSLSNPHYFTWNGMTWTADILLSRLVIMIAAVGVAIASALFFDRFNPSRLLLIKRKKIRPETPLPVAERQVVPVSNVHLTPLAGAPKRFRFDGLFVAELKLFLKGQRWWWYIIAAGLVLAQLITPLEWSRNLLLVAWVWPLLILSGLGCRENRFDTRQIVFSAPHPLANQLPAAWLSAFVVMAVLGSGVLIKFLLMGETVSALGWLTGAAFIPALALVLGTLTGSGKTFEAVYVVWMYALTQKVSPLDFAGLTPTSPLYLYAPLAVILFFIAVFVRQRQLTSRRILT